MAYQHWPYDTLHRLCMEAFQKFGFTEAEADIIQDVLLTADLYGIESHGMQRMVRYHKCIEKGMIDVHAKPEVVFETPISAVIDAHEAMGQLVSHKAMEMAIEKAKTADAFVFGTPVHYASASGNMTSFMDRLAYAGGKYLAYKPAAICCSARRAGTTSALDQLVKYPEFFHMPLVSGSYWPMVHGSNPEQVLQDAEGCAVMQELGRNMAWLLRCIEAGKAAGIQHPENPRRPMTNFIR